MRRQYGRHPLRARSQAEGLRIGCIRRMPRQRANVSRSRACRHGELRSLCAMSAPYPLSSGGLTDWMHTANAATASEKHSAFQLGVREPVGMANCVVHALCMSAPCSHVSRSKFTCMHTANAATASEKHSAFQLGVREPVGMANCVVRALCTLRART